jgi:hypothetical protein
MLLGRRAFFEASSLLLASAALPWPALTARRRLPDYYDEI